MEQFDFFKVPEFSDGVVTLRLSECVPHRKDNWAPSYNFFGYLLGWPYPIGHIHLRIGMNENIYYGGHIGYGIREANRGHGYAAHFCRLVPPLALAHNMTELIITTTQDNIASIKTIESLGAKFLGDSHVPCYNELYSRGMKVVRRYVWDVSHYTSMEVPL